MAKSMSAPYTKIAVINGLEMVSAGKYLIIELHFKLNAIFESKFWFKMA